MTKVTQAMIDAAWPILDAYDHDYSDAPKCLADIFAAMEMARADTAPKEETPLNRKESTDQDLTPADGVSGYDNSGKEQRSNR